MFLLHLLKSIFIVAFYVFMCLCIRDHLGENLLLASRLKEVQFLYHIPFFALISLIQSAASIVMNVTFLLIFIPDFVGYGFI